MTPWPNRDRRSGRLAVELALAALACCGLVLGLFGFHVSRAGIESTSADEPARQVTIFGVIATPGSSSADSNLTSIHGQLEKLLPKHGFRLLDAQSKRLLDGESVTCKLTGDYTVRASLVQTVDENGKVQVRCELFHGEDREFSTLVKTPLHQLFFCQRALQDGSQLLIGVGAR